MRPVPFALERFFARYEFSTRYMLGSSDCESVRVRELLALEPGSEDRLLDLRLGYTESAGLPALRDALAEAFYPRLGAARVLVCAGAEEVLFLYMNAVLTAGDHVVVHTPCYASLVEIPRALGCEVSAWEARPEAAWTPDVRELAGLLRPDTRLVVLNTPHNPTGGHLTNETFAEVVALLRARGIRLLCDEVYRELEPDVSLRLPPAAETYEHAASVGVLSKTYGLPGLRIGWLATADDEALRAVAALKDYTTICNAAPSELLATVAVRHRDVLADRTRGIVRSNLAALTAFFARHQDTFEWVPPTAGPITLARLVGRDDDEAFAMRAAEAAGVLVVPGSTFAKPGYLRIGFGRSDFREALTRFEEHIRNEARGA